MQGVDRIIVSVLVIMENIIKSNTSSMRDIVSTLESTLVDKHKEIIALQQSNQILKTKIEKLEREQKVKEEDIAYLVELNKPLEKAYRSLQRKYQRVVDRLDRNNRDNTHLKYNTLC